VESVLSQWSDTSAQAFTTPGFTEASANAAIEIGDRLIMPIQRFIKRDLEMLWRKAITSANPSLDPVKAAVRLNWGVPETPELEITDVLRAFELQAIRRDEVRKNLVKAGFELWEPERRSETKLAGEEVKA